MSIARHHAEWLSLVESSGPFLSMPVLTRAFPTGLDGADSEQTRGLRLAYSQWRDGISSRQTDRFVHRQWVRFVLGETLGLPVEVLKEGQGIPETLTAESPDRSECLRPDLLLVDPDSSASRLLVVIEPPDQDLRRARRGVPYPASPETRMADLLRATGVRLGLVTNGEHWMLVNLAGGETPGYCSWYAPLWLEEPLTLRAFRSLLGVDRFFNVPQEGTLEALLAESATDQQEVTDQLGYQVRRAVEMLVQAFDRIDRDSGRTVLAGIEEKTVYEAALAVMMRLVFLFCAEERNLIWPEGGAWEQHYSVTTLLESLLTAASENTEEVLERRCDAWSRMLATFRAVHGGIAHEDMRLPAYGGSLFDPDRFPFLEGRKAGEAWYAARPLAVNNRTVMHLLMSLQRLEVRTPGGGPAEARRLSFRELGIEQIGHVYEGLLDHTAVRATEPVLGLAGTRDLEPEIGLSILEGLGAKGDAALADMLRAHTGRSEGALRKALAADVSPEEERLLRGACDNDAALFGRVAAFAGLVRKDAFGQPVMIHPGSLYVTQGAERRATGTHYTPQSLTEPIVRRTLEPLVYRGVDEGVHPSRDTLRTPKEILALRVCDLACGSAAFLVQACRYLSERLVEGWERIEEASPDAVIVTPEGEVAAGEPEERLLPVDRDERLALARRFVVDRCLYGVDKNPMAVEMAKLSLWLVTMQRDRPFTFLDHAIKCGDSLVGVDLAQLRTWSLDRKGGKVLDIFVAPVVEQALGLRRALIARDELDIEDVHEKERLHAAAEGALRRAKLAADLIVAPSFAFTKPKEQDTGRKRLQEAFLIAPAPEDGHHPLIIRRPELGPDLPEQAASLLGAVRPFHWPLEFPEVFDGETPGFDAIVGNPPFMGGTFISGSFGETYQSHLVRVIAEDRRGNADLVAFFFLRAFQMLRRGGTLGLLATKTIAEGGTRAVALDHITGCGGSIFEATPSRPWPGQASLHVAVVQILKGRWRGERILDGRPVSDITSRLTDSDAATHPTTLGENTGCSYTGNKVYGDGFVLTISQAERLLSADSRYADVVFPYLNAEDVNSQPDQSASRWVIHFGRRTEAEARVYGRCFEIVERLVKPYRETVNREHTRRNWWLHEHTREPLYAALEGRSRVVVCPEVTKHLSFVFVATGQVYSDRLDVFPEAGSGDLAVLQTSLHDTWARTYSSHLETRLKYSLGNAFETFPFPRPSEIERLALNDIGEAYHEHRRHLMLERQIGLTKAYNLLHDPSCRDVDIERLRSLHAEMDTAVRDAYGWSDMVLGHDFHGEGKDVRFTISAAAKQEALRRLLALNQERAAEEARAEDERKAADRSSKIRTRRAGKRVGSNAAIDGLG